MKTNLSAITIALFFLLTECNGKRNNSHHQKQRVSATADKKDKAGRNSINAGKQTFSTLPVGIEVKPGNFLMSEKYFISLIFKNYENVKDAMIGFPHGQKQNAYDLPPIKSIQYLSVPGPLLDSCQDKKPFGNYLKLTKYRYRLPDINGFECYYWCDYQDPNKSDYSDVIRINCNSCVAEGFYGYLIFYDRKSARAKVLLSYFDIQPEEIFYYRFFYIGADHQIKLFDFSLYSDGDGKAAPDPSATHIIRLMENGELVVK